MGLNFSNIGKKERAGLAIAGIIVLFAVLDRLIIMPIAHNFKKANAEIRKNEKILAQGLINVGQKDDIAREYQKYAPYLKLDYSEGEAVAKLLEEIEGMGRGAGIDIADIKPQPPKQVDAFRYYHIEIEATGSMDSMINFLYQLHNSKRLFRASKIYITIKDRGTSTVKAAILVTKAVLP
jgi:Tfp pilus assembly protein PilO